MVLYNNPYFPVNYQCKLDYLQWKNKTMHQYHIRSLLFYEPVQAPGKKNKSFIQSHKMVLNTILLVCSSIIDPFNADYFMLFGQLLQDTRVKTDPFQPGLWAVKLLSFTIAYSYDPHYYSISCQPKKYFPCLYNDNHSEDFHVTNKGI